MLKRVVVIRFRKVVSAQINVVLKLWEVLGAPVAFFLFNSDSKLIQYHILAVLRLPVVIFYSVTLGFVQ